MSDRIELTGLRGTGFHGVFEHERRAGQEFVVDLVLEVDTRAAAASDDLADTVDYGSTAVAVHELITGPAFDLIETLAERIAGHCLSRPGVAAVEVSVHKPSAPIPVPFTDVVVRIRRQRAGREATS